VGADQRVRRGLLAHQVRQLGHAHRGPGEALVSLEPLGQVGHHQRLVVGLGKRGVKDAGAGQVGLQGRLPLALLEVPRLKIFQDGAEPD
jgi:hypothetical protein